MSSGTARSWCEDWRSDSEQDNQRSVNPASVSSQHGPADIVFATVREKFINMFTIANAVYARITSG